MERRTTRNRYLTAGAATLCGLMLLSGCVSSAINTPENFAVTPRTAQTADVQGLDNPDGSQATPDTAQSDISQMAGGADTALEGEKEDRLDGRTVVLAGGQSGPVVETIQAPLGSTDGQSAINSDASEAIIAEATSDIDDVATQRIAAASNTPIMGGGTTNSTASTVPQVPVITARPVQQNRQAAAAPEKNRPGLLSALFGNRTKKPSVPVGGPPKVVVTSPTQAAPAPQPVSQQRVIATASASGYTTSSLPGVDRDRALGVNTASGNISGSAPVQLASAAGLARLAPNGLTTQHAEVDIKCLKPALVRILKSVEKKYGKPAIITSGYRSPSRNKRARGAKNSLHMYCAAADIQVEGVAKATLANFLRSMPGRGGVGTYCNTKSVHIDIGPNRNWNWRCRRR